MNDKRENAKFWINRTSNQNIECLRYASQCKNFEPFSVASQCKTFNQFQLQQMGLQIGNFQLHHNVKELK